MMHFELEENSGGRGLPEKLPDGERILWQGAPDWRVLLRRAFHARLLAGYFALLIGWHATEAVSHGVRLAKVAHDAGIYGGLSLVPLLIAALYCYLAQRTTVYTLTEKRLVMSYGVGLSLSVNLPYSKIRAAGLRIFPGGAGDIPLTLLPGEHVTYFMIWPHALPWHWREPAPMLRGIPQAGEVARILSRALAAEAGIAVQVAGAHAAQAAGRGLVAAE